MWSGSGQGLTASPGLQFTGLSAGRLDARTLRQVVDIEWRTAESDSHLTKCRLCGSEHQLLLYL